MTQTNDSSFTRRAVLASASAGAGAAALGGTPAMAQTAQRKTFVLVHGAWHGGWCWRRVSDLLEKQGHKVFTPTLTGVGERSHLMSKDINLDTHITDIANVFKWEDLKDVCLVVHSYGGYPGSGALLEKQGHKVFTPTLTGVAAQDVRAGARRLARRLVLAAGARCAMAEQPPSAAALAPALALASMARRVSGESLVVVIISSRGIYRCGDRVSSIVWLDAFKPENGERLFDVTSEFSRKGLLAAMEKG